MTDYVSENMSRKVIFCTGEDNLRSAYQIMQSNQIRHIPVIDGDELVGVLSSKDIYISAQMGEDGELIVPNVNVKEAMTRQPITCDAKTKISDVARIMVRRKIDCLPVIGKQGHLVGMITSSDLLELLEEEEDQFFGARIIPFNYELIRAHLAQ